ncbi:MAG TPA: Uma2 family endonuclease [Thermoanaerobaculia bacterium]|jgi:Uma2 family endonuclease
MAPQTSTKLTYEDYLQLPDDGNRYEIIDGELILNASPVPRHQRILRKLLVPFDLHFTAHGGGEVLCAPLDVVLSPENMFQPDLMVFVGEQRSAIGEKNVQSAPDLVIEILSGGSRRHDEIVKRNAYERFGVAEYWIVDPELELVKIYRRGPNGFERASEVENDKGGLLATPLVPGFALDIRLIFT